MTVRNVSAGTQKGQKLISKKGELIHILKELEVKEKEIKEIKKQKSKELYQLEKDYPNLLIEPENKLGKKYFYCGKCRGDCKGLARGYFH